MHLIRTLNEASATPIEDLKDQMKRDKRVSMVFSRSLEPDEIADKKEFLLTLKYYLLNNKEVQNFIKARAGLNVSTWEFDRLRKYGPADIEDPKHLEELRKIVAAIFRDVGRVGGKTLSSNAMSYLRDHITGAKSGHFDHYTANELKSLKLTSSVPVKLYYGVNFTEYDFNDVQGWLGGKTVAEPGPAVKFISSINTRKKQVDLDFPHAKVLTTSLEKAESIAKYGIHRRHQYSSFIGEVGFVVSILVSPGKQLFSTDAYTSAGGKGFEDLDGYFLIDSGKYRGKIIKKLTRRGEDDISVDNKHTALDDIAEDVSFIYGLVKPITYNDQSMYRVGTHLTRTAAEKEALAWIVSLDGKKAILRSLKPLYELLLKMDEIEDDELKQALSANEYREIVKALTDLKSQLYYTFSETRAAFLPSAKKTPEEIVNPHEIKLDDRVKALRAFLYSTARDQRYTERMNLYSINSALYAMGIAPPQDLHRRSKAVQADIAQRLIDNFFTITGIPKPDDKSKQIAEFLTGYQQLTTLLTAAKDIDECVKYMKRIVDLTGKEN